MIKVIIENSGYDFSGKVNKLLSEGYVIYGAAVSNDKISNYPFIYTAILIKKL